jgi:hypothetical protein
MIKTNCDACEKSIRRDIYRWILNWNRPDTLGAPRAFEVVFHNNPECIRIMTARLDDYAYDQQMAIFLMKTAKENRDDESESFMEHRPVR